jgi:hypothetical protein
MWIMELCERLHLHGHQEDWHSLVTCLLAGLFYMKSSECPNFSLVALVLRLWRRSNSFEIWKLEWFLSIWPKMCCEIKLQSTKNVVSKPLPREMRGVKLWERDREEETCTVLLTMRKKTYSSVPRLWKMHKEGWEFTEPFVVIHTTK